MQTNIRAYLRTQLAVISGRKRSHHQTVLGRALIVTTAMLLLVSTMHAVAQVPTCDPAKVVGYEGCAKCHGSEIKQWMLTPHHKTFDLLHRTPEAKQIASKLGLRSIKRNDTCVKCHYTRQQVGSRVRAVSGISCESCHGPATDWLTLHNDYGPDITKLTESADHRAQRRKSSIAAGMNNPSNLYLIARQCLNCHTVPEEKLVNVGGHRAGSAEFELVAWSQGMVRHNFLQSDGATNRFSSPARLRVMYVVGTMADLEYSLRAVAHATEKSTFGITSAKRAIRMKNRLRKIQSTIKNKQVQEALDAVSKVKLTINNKAAIVRAANLISKAANTFAETADGNTLTNLDPMLPLPGQYKR